MRFASAGRRLDMSASFLAACALRAADVQEEALRPPSPPPMSDAGLSAAWSSRPALASAKPTNTREPASLTSLQISYTYECPLDELKPGTYFAVDGDGRYPTCVVLNEPNICRCTSKVFIGAGKGGGGKWTTTYLNLDTGRTRVDVQLGRLCGPMTFPRLHFMRSLYDLIDVNDEGFVSLLSEDGDARSDLRLPACADVARTIRDVAESEAGGTVVVISALGREVIEAFRSAQPAGSAADT